MNYVIDACSLINLDNGGVLPLILNLDARRLSVGPIVLSEVGETVAEILRAHAPNKVSILDDSDVSAEVFLKLLDEHQLGAGETEALVLAGERGLLFCSDDRKARIVASALYGANRVIGSLRLVQWCVQQKIFECVTAFQSFEAMKASGGFLPDVERSFFCLPAEDC